MKIRSSSGRMLRIGFSITNTPSTAIFLPYHTSFVQRFICNQQRSTPLSLPIILLPLSLSLSLFLSLLLEIKVRSERGHAQFRPREKVLTILIPKEAATPSFSPLRDIPRLRFTRNERMPTFREYARSSKNKAWKEGRSRSLWRQEKKEEREREKDNKRLASRFPPPCCAISARESVRFSCTCEREKKKFRGNLESRSLRPRVPRNVRRRNKGRGDAYLSRKLVRDPS